MSINLTLLGQMITFLLFALFVRRFVWPPIIKALTDRQSKIADGLAAAERGHVELSMAQQRADQLMKSGNETVAGLIVEARKQADLLIDAARQQAHDESTRIIKQAQGEIEHMISEAREVLRKQVASMVIVGAEKILAQHIDPSAHLALLDKLAQEI